MENTLANIEIELYEKDGQLYVFMTHDGSSGVKIKINDMEQLRKEVATYVEYCYLDNK